MVKKLIHDNAFNSLLANEMIRTILYGEMQKKAKFGPCCYKNILMNSLDEMCLIHSNTIRKFLYNESQLIRMNLFQNDKVKEKDVLGQSMERVMIILTTMS